MKPQSWIVVCNPAQRPLVIHEQHGTILAVIYEHAAICAAERLRRDRLIFRVCQPACDLKGLHDELDIDAVLVFEPIRQYVKLERTDRADDIRLDAGPRLTEKLDCSLLCQLFDTLDELLALHRILCLHSREFFPAGTPENRQT